MNLKQVEKRALNIARETGDRLRKGFREAKEIEYKTTAIDIVTQYDTEIEAFIIKELRQSFPDHEIFAEEGDYLREAKSNYTWYVDPIDGTNNFAHGYPVFAVSLALYENEDPLVGVIYDPTRDECFHAIKGGGAFLTSPEAERARLDVSETTELVGSLLGTGFPYDRHSSNDDNLVQFGAFLKRARGLRRAGAAALDLAFVAAGRLDGYWEYKLGRWDIAAGVLLVQEAGGKITNIDGSPFRMGQTDKVALLVSNGKIHNAMLQVLQSIATQNKDTTRDS